MCVRTEGQGGMPEQRKRRSVRQQQARTNTRLRQQAKASADRGYRDEKHVDLAAFNAGAEAGFVKLVRELIDEEDSKTIPIFEVTREAAYELGISTMTAKRYLMKYTARRAPFRIDGNAVILNPRYVADEDEADGDLNEQEEGEQDERAE